jgi:hypothetical protein
MPTLLRDRDDVAMSTRTIMRWMVVVAVAGVVAVVLADVDPAVEPAGDGQRSDVQRVERAIAVGYGGPTNPVVGCTVEEFDYVCGGDTTCYVTRNEQPPDGGDASVDYYECFRGDPNSMTGPVEDVCVIDTGDGMKIRDTNGGACVWRPD